MLGIGIGIVSRKKYDVRRARVRREWDESETSENKINKVCKIDFKSLLQKWALFLLLVFHSTVYTKQRCWSCLFVPLRKIDSDHMYEGIFQGRLLLISCTSRVVSLLSLPLGTIKNCLPHTNILMNIQVFNIFNLFNQTENHI